ncbi:Protein of unknown function (DUF3128) domain containing protein [Naviculisporaceae sp. PSN 640]
MGWFWQSSTPSSSNPGSTAASSHPPSSQQTPAASPPPPAQTPDQIEVQKFLQSFMEQAEPKAAAPPPPAAAATPPAQQTTSSSSSSLSSWLPWSKPAAPEATSQTESAPPPLPPKGRSPQSRQMSEYNLPTSMSCRDAFDYAWHCHTAGSQWNAVYRYGEMRSCSELWDDFWFCMRSRNYSEEARREAIKEHYRAKEERKYGNGKPSSEDIWESREERLPVGTAFKKEFPPPVEDDTAFRLSEIERRKRIRRELGIETDNEEKKE